LSHEEGDEVERGVGEETLSETNIIGRANLKQKFNGIFL